MKIITDDAVYVQMNDMMHLNQSDLQFPASVFMKVFGRGMVIIDNSNRFDFVSNVLSFDFAFQIIPLLFIVFWKYLLYCI